MGVQNASVDLPAMKSNPKVCCIHSEIRNQTLTGSQKFIFFTDFDGTITQQDSKS